MKELSHLILAFFLISSIAYAGMAETPSIKEMNQFLSKNIAYPSQARENGTTGTVVYSIEINEKGEFAGYSILSSPDHLLENEVERVLSMMKEEWKKDFLENKPVNTEYLLSFEFMLQVASNEIREVHHYSGDTPTPKKKASSLEPLEKLNQKIEMNPYSPKLYKERAEVHQELKNNEEAKRDYEKAETLEKEFLSQVVIVGYSPANTSSVR